MSSSRSLFAVQTLQAFKIAPCQIIFSQLRISQTPVKESIFQVGIVLDCQRIIVNSALVIPCGIIDITQLKINLTVLGGNFRPPD